VESEKQAKNIISYYDVSL